MARTYRRTDPVEPEASGSDGGARRRGFPWERAANALAIALAVITSLVLLFFIFLQTEPGRRWVEGVAVHELRALLAEGAELEVERVGGDFLRGARITGVVVREGNEVALQVDTLQVRYNIWTLFRQTFSASRVDLYGARVYAREDADGEWNLGRILRPPVEPDPPPTAWVVQIEELFLRRAAFEAHFYHPERDSVLMASPLALNMEDFRFDADGVRLRLDTLATVLWPAIPDGRPVLAAGSGALDTTRAVVDHFVLESWRSDVRIAGVMDWEDIFTFDGEARGAPLDLSDVRQFVDVPLYGTADVDLVAEGQPREMVGSLRADFRGHGALNVDVEYSRVPEGPTRLALDGRVNDLNLGRFINQPDLEGSLTGQVDFDLAGESLRTVSGPVDITLRGSVVGEQRIAGADLDGRFDEGRLRFDLAANVPGARGTMSGTTRPFDEVVTYDVRGDLRELDLALLLRDPEQDVRMGRIQFDVRGQGLEPETLAARGWISAADVRLDDLSFATARVEGRLEQGAMNFDGTATLPGDGGFIAARGFTRPFDEPLVYRVDQGEVRSLNLAALTGDPDMDSDLTGTFTIAGTGTEPETMRIDFALRLDDSRYDRFDILRADASGTLVGGVLEIDASADLAEAGQLTALGTIRPFADPVTYDLTGTVNSLNLAVLLDDPTLDSDLTGVYTITGRGFDPETMVADFRIELEDSRYRDQILIAGTMEGRLAAGRLDATIQAITPEGQIAFAIVARPFDPEFALAVTDATFTGVNLALILDAPWLQTDLTGRIEVDYRGPDLPRAVATGQIVLEQSQVNAAVIEGAVIEFGLDRGDVSAVAAINTVEGEAGLIFAGRPFDEVPTYAIDARLDTIDLLAFVGDEPQQSLLTGEIEIEGTGLDPRTMVAEADIRLGPSALPQAAIDTLVADVSIAQGLIQARTVELSADFADLTAEGQIALYENVGTTDLTFAADIRDAGPINAFLDETLIIESANVEGRAVGPAGGPVAFDGNAIVRRATYNGYGVSRLDARINAEYFPDEEIPIQGQARVRFDFLSLPTFNARRGDVVVTYIDEEIAATGEVVIDDFREVGFSTRLEAIDDPVGEYHTALLIDDLSLRIDEERWELLQPATLSIGDGRYLVRNFLLFSDDQQIAADGRIDTEGTQTLIVTMDAVQLDPFVDLIGYEGVGGILSATVAFGGPAASPEIEATVTIEEMTTRDEPVGALSASFAYAEQQLDIDALLTHVEGQELIARGVVPFAFRLDGEPAEIPLDAPVELRLTGEDFPIAWAEPFFPPRMIRDIGGTLTADVLITGTEGDPLLEGEAVVTDGLLQLDVTGDAVFRNITLHLDFDGNLARIRTGRVEDGRGGTLRIDGTIVLPRLTVGELDLQLVATNFRVIETRTYRRLIVSASPGQNLRFSGTIADPVLTGNLTLVSGDIYLTEELVGPDVETVELTEAQIQRVEETFGMRVIPADVEPETFMDNLDLDVGIAIERNVWLRSRRNPRLDIEFIGQVDVEKPPQTDFQLFGELEVLRGRVELPTLAGRAFQIGAVDDTFGQIIFNGPLDEALVDVRAGLPVQDRRGGSAATIFVTYSGRLGEEPEFELSADPFMDTADIACVIATGRPCGEAFQGRIAEEVAIAQLGALVQNIAAQGLGLDVVEVTQRATGEIVVTAGTYVTDRVFASIRQPITEPRSTVEESVSMTPEITVEYEMLRWLLLRAERRNIGGTGASLLFQYDY